MNQKGVLIKDKNGVVVEKRVYSGDISDLADILTKEGVRFTIFDDFDLSFISASLPIVKTVDDRIDSLESAVATIQLTIKPN